MRTTTLSLLAAAALALAACGGDDDEASAPATTQEAKPAATDVGPLPSDPQQIACGHLANPDSRQASNALAAEAEIEGVSQLQASQSIYFAMTQICKGQEAAYKPAKEAVAGVKSGKYEADLGSP